MSEQEQKPKNKVAPIGTEGSDVISSIPQVSGQAGLSVEALLKMLVETQQQQAQANRELASALLESRKPYVDPKVLEAKQADLEQRKQQIEIELSRRANNKAFCPHVRENGSSCISWMQHSNRIVTGVCSACGSSFDARYPKDGDRLRNDLKSQQNMGRAGEHSVTRVVGRV